MASELKNLSSYDPAEIPQINGKRIGIVVSDYNTDITFSLRDAAIETLQKHGVLEADISVSYVPGSFELPSGAQLHMDHHHCDAVIVLGCVITGETKHDEYISTAVANGIMQLNLIYKKPFIFGLLTPRNQAQALARAGGELGNKGIEAAIAAIKMLAIKEKYAKKGLGYK
jgi:6,7-dimethyl-8-ribityllumazine synthase